MTPILLAIQMLKEAGGFFEDRGAEGLEGTALIVQHADGVADRLVIPQQVAARVGGCWVEVPLGGKLELAAAIGPDERYIARIHSHPGDAFHSPADDRNPALTFEGALSIVVPYFGLGLRRGLAACAVYRRQGKAWVELPPGSARDRWVGVR